MKHGSWRFLLNCRNDFYLEPSSEYVISLKAFNSMGEGVPIYETTVTREESSKLISLNIELETSIHLSFCFI